MKKSDRTKLFSETFELNELIISIACILQANGYDVNVVDSNEDWLLHGLVSKEMYCEINGIAIKMTSSYAYTDNERGFLLMHYKKYIDKWTREVVVRKNVKDEKGNTIEVLGTTKNLPAPLWYRLLTKSEIILPTWVFV